MTPDQIAPTLPGHRAVAPYYFDGDEAALIATRNLYHDQFEVDDETGEPVFVDSGHILAAPRNGTWREWDADRDGQPPPGTWVMERAETAAGLGRPVPVPGTAVPEAKDAALTLYRFHWKDRTRNEGPGTSPADALKRLGFGGGAVAALDFYEVARAAGDAP